MTTQSEQILENGLIDTLVKMNYKRINIEDEFQLIANFRSQLEVHNKIVLSDEEFNRIMIHLESGSIFDKASRLRDKYPLELTDGSIKWIEFLNTQEWCQNEFQVANQITDEGRRLCRYDVTILVNGLPLVQVELKRRGVELKQAYSQIQRYHKTAFQGLFNYIQLFVISNGVNTRYFANNANQGYKFTFRWADKKNNHIDRLEVFAAMFFEQCTLGKMISKYFVLGCDTFVYECKQRSDLALLGFCWEINMVLSYLLLITSWHLYPFCSCHHIIDKIIICNQIVQKVW